MKKRSRTPKLRFVKCFGCDYKEQKYSARKFYCHSCTSKKVEAELRFCRCCKETKRLEEFTKDPKGSLGFRFKCKQCTNKDKSPYDSEKGHKYNIKKSFGITIDEYNDLLKKQNGCCKICKTDKCQSGKRFAVDHDHKTGKIRGLLCGHCNTGLGKFRDNPDLIDEAAKYLREFQE